MFHLQLLWKLVWKNRTIRSRICTSIGFSLFLLIAIPILEFFEIASMNTYMLLFLPGMFYHFYVTVQSLSCLYCYNKFLVYYEVLMKLFLVIYLLGVLSSLVSCLILLGYSWVGFMKVDAGELYFSLLVSNFVMAPLCFWISSYDFVKIDLFSPLSGFYQPRSVYMLSTLVSVVVFSLLVDAHREFGWPFGLSVKVVLLVIGVVGVRFKFMKKKVYINCQKSIIG